MLHRSAKADKAILSAPGEIRIADPGWDFNDRGALTVDRGSPDSLAGVIPEIDIWRVANLMLTRYGDAAVAEAAKQADELAANADLAGVAVWLQIIDAIRQLSETTPTGPVH